VKGRSKDLQSTPTVKYKREGIENRRRGGYNTSTSPPEKTQKQKKMARSGHISVNNSQRDPQREKKPSILGKVPGPEEDHEKSPPSPTIGRSPQRKLKKKREPAINKMDL